MDTFQAIKSRRSIRSFNDKAVSDEEIEKLIDAARFAPSAGNLQPWEFIIVKEPKRKRQLSVAALNQHFIEEAPIVIVVCANETRSGRRYGRRGVTLYCIQDTAAATQNLLLAAYSLGLSTCWIGAFREKLVRESLKTPSHVRPVAMIPVGFSSRKPKQRRRRPIAEITHQETY
ncbi:MAG: nitroreductase family protein [Candidatus Bathyarchaeota archaeon]|nr:MAG: nitroreductase family protein [Candidatus Bathyarchaeota archaeon]